MTLNEYINELIAFRDKEEAGDLQVRRQDKIDGLMGKMRDPDRPKIWSVIQKDCDHLRIGPKGCDRLMTAPSTIPIECPFTILIDRMEKHPFSFTNLYADSDQDYRPIVVRHRWEALGVSNGDYSIDGHHPNPIQNVDRDAPRLSLERKSVDDCIGTILGFADRRPRFERELSTLASIIDAGGSAAVFVEGSVGAVLEAVEAYGKRSAEDNRKSLFRSWISFQQDYRVPWIFCDSRRLAEIYMFRWMERFWRRVQMSEKSRTEASCKK